MAENKTTLPDFEIIPYAVMLIRLPELAQLQKTGIPEVAFCSPDDPVAYFDGDVTLSKKQAAQLQGHVSNPRLWAVNGDLRLDAPCIYNVYVRGDLHCELFVNTAEQRVGGTIFSRLYAAFLADRREGLHSSYSCKLETPYLFVWYIDISSFLVGPQTVTFIMCSASNYEKLPLTHPHFYRKEGIYVLKPEMCYYVEPYDDDTPYWNWSAIKPALERGAALFIDGFDVASWHWYRTAQACAKEGKTGDAFDLYKKAIDLSPNWYTAWFEAGQLLYNTGAFAQSLPFLQQASRLFPPYPKTPNHAAGLYAKAQALE